MRGSGVPDLLSLATRGTNMNKDNRITTFKDIEQARTAEEAAWRAEKRKREEDRDRHAGCSQSTPNHGPSNSKAVPSGRGAKPPTDFNKKEEDHKRRHYSGPSTNHAGEGNSRRRRFRRKPEIPFAEPGKPGARDDPLRKGLSGASSQKYLKYLAEGIKPEEARKIIDVEVKARRDSIKNPPAHREPTSKRVRESVTPKSQEKLKRPRVDDHHHQPANKTGISYASAAKITKVAVLPKEYPQINLTAEELAQLEEAIIEEVTLTYGGTTVPRFGGIFFRSGHLVIDCESEETVMWLKDRVPSMKIWKGPALDTKVGDDIPKPHIIKCFLPRSAGQETKRSLILLGTQNGLSIEHWKVLAHRDEGTGQVLTIGIDDVSLKRITEQDQVLSYRFGKISAQILKHKVDVKIGEEEEKSKETDIAGTSGKEPNVNDTSTVSVGPSTSSDNERPTMMEGSEEEDEILDLTVLAINIPSVSEEEDLLKEEVRPTPPTSPKK